MIMRVLLLLITVLSVTSTSIRHTTHLRSFEDPPATPPGDEDASSDPSTGSEAAVEPQDPLTQALNAVKQTESNLDNVRDDLHGKVEDVQEAAIAVTDHARNVSEPDAYSTPTATIDETSIAIQSVNASMPDIRDATVKAREEARRIELDTIRQQTEENHKQEEAAANENGDNNPADASGPANSNSDEEEEPTDGEAIKALSINSRVPLLKELVEATRDHTAQTTKYAQLALDLQKQRMASTSKINGTSNPDDDEDTVSILSDANVDCNYR